MMASNDEFRQKTEEIEKMRMRKGKCGGKERKEIIIKLTHYGHPNVKM